MLPDASETQAPNGRQLGASSLRIDWGKLDINIHDLRKPLASFLDDDAPELELDRHKALQAANYLRLYGSSLDVADSVDKETYVLVEGCVDVLQRYHDQLDPLWLRQSLRECGNRAAGAAHGGQGVGHFAYKVSTLITQCVWQTF